MAILTLLELHNVIYESFAIIELDLNPVQTGVFWYHIGWGGGGGAQCAPLFLLYLWSN